MWFFGPVRVCSLPSSIGSTVFAGLVTNRNRTDSYTDRQTTPCQDMSGNRPHLASAAMRHNKKIPIAWHFASYYDPRRRGEGALSGTAIRPSVCPSPGYRHAGCLQPAGHQRCADCGVRTRPRTDVDPPRVELPSAWAYRLAAPGAITCSSKFANFSHPGSPPYVIPLDFRRYLSRHKNQSPYSLGVHNCSRSVVCETVTVAVQDRRVWRVSARRSHALDAAAASECERSSPRSSWTDSRKSSSDSSTWSALRGPSACCDVLL